MHLTSSPALWYAARASGVAAYVVLSAVVGLGLGLGGKAQSHRWPRFSVEDVHRFGGLLVGSLIAIHVATIAADSFLPFSLSQLVVPFTANYRPLWTGLGIAAAELLLARSCSGVSAASSCARPASRPPASSPLWPCRP